MRGRDAASCSKVSDPRATADSNSRNDALERTPSPPQGLAAPHRLHPPLPSFSLLHLCHPHTRQHPAAATAKLQRCALAFPATACAGSRRSRQPQGHSTAQTHPALAPWGTELPPNSPPQNQTGGFSPSQSPGMLQEKDLSAASVCLPAARCGGAQQTLMPAGQGHRGVR